MNLSPSQSRILACLKAKGMRYLPKEAVITGYAEGTGFHILGCRWEWSWTISQETKTADYRKRLSELREMGYRIVSFHVGNRHGYILCAEPEGQEEMNDAV